MSGSHLSRDFFDLVKAIGECRSKQEEDQIIENETIILKSKFSDSIFSSDPKKFKEYLLRSVYVEMLGHDASTFAYIHAVNMCHNKNLIAKRVGYLVSTLFLNPSSELMLLLINTIQKDLRSSNILEISFALIVVSKLANAEMVPVLLSLIQPLLIHQNELVRRRAIIAFHRLVIVAGQDSLDTMIDPGLVQQVVRRALGDVDPSVMGAALNLIHQVAINLSQETRGQIFRDLVPSLENIQRQILDHKLPKDYEYHRLPAPWIQMKLVQIFALLGEKNEFVSNQLFDVLSETMRRCDIMSNAGAALIFEVIKTATIISPHNTLLEHCSLYVSKFLNSDNYNYKYIGVTSLSLMVGVNPTFANEHQITVVDCLEDADETLKRRTMDLLFKMTNHNNVEVVVERLLAHLAASETQAKDDLVSKICSLAEKYAPSNKWFFETINMVYLEAGSGVHVPETVGHNLIRLIAEQDGEEVEGEEDLRTLASNGYIRLLEKFLSEETADFSPSLLQLMIWVIGEYATMSNLEGYSVDDVLDLLMDGMNHRRQMMVDDCLKSGYHLTESFVTAIAKVGMFASEVSRSQIESLFSNLLANKSLSHDVRRRCKEYLMIMKRPVNVGRAVLPFDASCEDIQVNLNHLDTFVKENAKRISTRKFSLGIPSQPSSVARNGISGLRFDAYETPSVNRTSAVSSVASSSKLVPISSGSVTQLVEPTLAPVVTRPAPAKQRWGPSGYQGTVTSSSSIARNESSAAVVAAAPAPTIPSLVAPIVAKPVVSVSQEKLLEKQKKARALFGGVRSEETKKEAAPPLRKGSDLLNFD